jgi:hypothetical protein
MTSNGGEDFITKLNASGDVLWAEKINGTMEVFCTSIFADKYGNSFITGAFYGTMTFGGTTITSVGDKDIFIAKIDSNGNFKWLKKAGGTGWDTGHSITLDDQGFLYVAGNFSSSTTFGNTNLTSNGSNDIFIAKLDSLGNFLWAKKAGGTENDYSNSVKINSQGDIFFTGIFRGNAIFGNNSLLSSGECDIFIAKLDSLGNFLWAKKAGGTENDYSRSIFLDKQSNCYVTGSFKNSANFGSTTINSPIEYRESDIFLTKLDGSGNFLWAKKIDNILGVKKNIRLNKISKFGNNRGYGSSVTVDSKGNSYTTGLYNDNIIIVKNDPLGKYIWIKEIDSDLWNFDSSITIDNQDVCYMTGCFNDFATFGSMQLESAGYYDAFIVKFK